MNDNIENNNIQPENNNIPPKKPTGIITIVLAVVALVATLGIVLSGNNPLPNHEQPNEYPEANYEIVEGYLAAPAPKNSNDEEVFITNQDDFKCYLDLYQDVVIFDDSSEELIVLEYSDILEKFNQDFFKDNNLAIKTHVVLAGHTEYCVQKVLKNNNQAIIEMNKYLYVRNDDIDAMPAPELECVFIVLDKDITSAKYDIKEVERKVGFAEEHAIHVAKPVIYLYPEFEMNVNVRLGEENELTCVYPFYDNGWNVFAKPNGDLVDLNTGRSQYCLYYEAIGKYAATNDGFVIKGKDSAAFLEEKLAVLGLSEREANEFIIYWLPRLEANEYNYIRFATMEEINSNMSLNITPAPDSIIRVVMLFKGLDEPIDVEEQILETPERKGFTVVEWGGTELK